MKKLNVAIVGQGRSGRNIHGKYFQKEENTFFDVVAVVDFDPERRTRAMEEFKGCVAYASHTELYGRDDIDLVVNASKSKYHYSVTKDLLENGFNVVVEKPFAGSKYECDDLIRIAKKKNVTLAVFQQSLFSPSFVNAKKIMKSGVLGEIHQISINFSGFSRRWDWQTAQTELAGNIYNTGPHPIGYALSFLDFDPEFKVVFSKLGCSEMTSGDSDDYAKILLTAPGKPIVDIEVHSNDAYKGPVIKFIGSKGTFISSHSDYEMKYIVDGENPKRELILESLKDEDGYPVYCSEELKTHEEKGEIVGTSFDVGTRCFYEMMYNTIANGAELIIKPEYAAMVVSVIEQAHAANPLPVLF